MRGNNHYYHTCWSIGNYQITGCTISNYCTTVYSIIATYPEADATTVQNTVTQVIEQSMNGIDNLVYMSSTSDAMSNMSLTLTFESGPDPNIDCTSTGTKQATIDNAITTPKCAVTRYPYE
ncbi:MAG: efflux RND transporter permease subunit [Candidatus Phlomobacter fragariae]